MDQAKDDRALADAAEQWFVMIKNDRHGPMPRQELLGMFTSGKITLTSHIWKKGMSDWVTLGQVVELKESFRQSNRSQIPVNPDVFQQSRSVSSLLGALSSLRKLSWKTLAVLSAVACLGWWIVGSRSQTASSDFYSIDSAKEVQRKEAAERRSTWNTQMDSDQEDSVFSSVEKQYGHFDNASALASQGKDKEASRESIKGMREGSRALHQMGYMSNDDLAATEKAYDHIGKQYDSLHDAEEAIKSGNSIKAFKKSWDSLREGQKAIEQLKTK